MLRIASVGHAVFAATLVVLGIMGVIKGTAIWEPIPKTIAGHEALVYLTDVIFVAVGAGLLWKLTATAAARVLFAYFLCWWLLARVPGLFRSLSVDVYWSACRDAVMVAAAWVLYSWFAGDWDRHRLGFMVGDKGLRIARGLYGLAMIPFGLAQFQYVARTAGLIPSWLPWHLFWAYFTGWCFVAAGLAMIVGLYGRLAASLSGLQMGLFLPLVWVPAMMAGTMNTFEWGEALVTWVLTAAAWVVADSYRGIPWLAAAGPRVRTTAYSA